jgi:hypothetical protein
MLYAWMSAWTFASRPVSRFLTFNALASVISAIGASSLLQKTTSQTPGVPVRFAPDQGESPGGISPKGVEDEGEIKSRKDFLQKIGYK